MIGAVLVAIALSQPPPPQQAQAPQAQGPVLTLDQAIKDAQVNNLDLQVAQARLEQTRAVVSKAWSSYLPQISVGGSYTRNNVGASITLPTGYWVRNVGTPQGPAFDPTQPPGIDNPPGAQTTDILVPSGLVSVTIQKLNQLGAQAQVTQALIVPQAWQAIANAYQGVRVAELGTEAARREVLFGVATLYYAAAGLKQAIGAQERLLQLSKDREKDADLRFRAGASVKLALLRAQIDRSKAERDLHSTQNSYASLKLALGTLLARSPDFEVQQPPPPSIPADVAGLKANALEQRPDIAAARASEQLSRGLRAATWFKYAPSIVGLGNYRVANVQGFTGTYDSWSVGLGLNWTIFDGGLREAEGREGDARIAEAEASRKAAEIRARDELSRALLDLENARANKAKAEEQLSLARENFQLAKVNLQAGAASDLDLQEAATQLSGAETAAVSEALNADLSGLRVLKAAGAFNPQ